MVFSLYVECCMGVLENKGKIRGRAAPKGLRPSPCVAALSILFVVFINLAASYKATANRKHAGYRSFPRIPAKAV